MTAEKPAIKSTSMNCRNETLKMFNELYTQLAAVDAAAKSKSPPPPAGGAEKIKAAAGQQPEPIRAMLEQLAEDVWLTGPMEQPYGRGINIEIYERESSSRRV